MCDCIKKAEEMVAANKGAAFAEFEHWGARTSEVSFKLYTKSGDIYKHYRYTSVPWKFCPFCGESITS